MLSLPVVTPWTVAHWLLCPWSFLGKKTGVGLEQPPWIVLTQGLNLCLLHWQASSLPLSHALSFSRGSSQTRDKTPISCTVGGLFSPEPPWKPERNARLMQKTALSWTESCKNTHMHICASPIHQPPQLSSSSDSHLSVSGQQLSATFLASFLQHFTITPKLQSSQCALPWKTSGLFQGQGSYLLLYLWIS